MFVRLSDKARFYNNEYKEFCIKKRKDNTFLSWRFDKNKDLIWEMIPIEFKKIPKKFSQHLNGSKIKFIKTKTTEETLVFQDFDLHQLSFINSDLEKIAFDDITKGTELSMYDVMQNNYYFDEVAVSLVIDYNILDLKADNKTVEHKEFKHLKLSNYIMRVDDKQGLIINNFMVI